jgi:DNA-binding NarL/FixJ family response regulator
MIRLLIVDDIASTRENLQKLLGFEDDIEVIGTAGDGREAVDAAHKLGPDIILMDVNMPLMDGIQATELLAQELPTSPVIIMSVQGERDYLRRAMQAGAREFLIKPFSHDELVAAIRRVYALEQKKGTYLAKQQVAVAESQHRSGRDHPRLLRQGRGRPHAGRLQPGGRPGRGDELPGGPRGPRPPVRRRRGDAQHRPPPVDHRPRRGGDHDRG